jgi:hypothetical protein
MCRPALVFGLVPAPFPVPAVGIEFEFERGNEIRSSSSVAVSSPCRVGRATLCRRRVIGGRTAFRVLLLRKKLSWDLPPSASASSSMLARG